MQVRSAVIASVAVATTWTVLHAQAPAPSGEADGRVHVALTLEAQEIRVAYAPDLRADDPDHRALLGARTGARARVGTLNAHRALRIGSLVPGLVTVDGSSAAAGASASMIQYELTLGNDASGWTLEARRSDRSAGQDDPDEPDEQDAAGVDVATIPLVHRETRGSAPSLTMSLHPTSAEAGRLVLRWGQHVWSAEFRFDELPPPPPTPRVSGRGQARQADTDTSAFSRGTTMAERNESVLGLPDGARIATLFWKGVDVEDEDYAGLDATGDGEIVRLVRAPVLRLKTDVALRFGAVSVPTGNLAPGFAGAYGIWLRRMGDGWRFVFNHEADSWGTQYDADYDAAELDVTYSRSDGAFRPLALTVAPVGPDRGRLIVHWGPHEWAADFDIVRE